MSTPKTFPKPSHSAKCGLLGEKKRIGILCNEVDGADPFAVLTSSQEHISQKIRPELQLGGNTKWSAMMQSVFLRTLSSCLSAGDGHGLVQFSWCKARLGNTIQILRIVRYVTREVDEEQKRLGFGVSVPSNLHSCLSNQEHEAWATLSEPGMPCSWPWRRFALAGRCWRQGLHVHVSFRVRLVHVCGGEALGLSAWEVLQLMQAERWIAKRVEPVLYCIVRQIV